MDELEITFDHNYMYANGEKFFPIIQEQADDLETLDSTNGLLIHVKSEEEGGDWQSLYRQAEEAVQRGKWIFWELDLLSSERPIFLEDSSSFFSLGLTLEEFARRLWKPFKGCTVGVSLFRGCVDFSRYFLWTEQHEKHYKEKKQEYPFLSENQVFLRQLFAVDVFSEYLLRLASFLPDELPIFCLLDVSLIESHSQLALLLSKERFQHLLLALKKSKIALGHLNWEEGACLGGWIGTGAPYFATVPGIATAVCLPAAERITPAVMQVLDQTFSHLLCFDIPFRIVEENRLNEGWDGIDDLIVLTSSVTLQGMRKLQGFLAAGGRIVSAEGSLGLEGEISLVEFTKNLSRAEALF